MTSIDLGQRIQHLLTERNWRQATLAERVGIEKSHLSRLIRGSRSWQPDQLDRVAKAFEIGLAELVEGTNVQGLPEANRSVHDANKELTEHLAETAAARDVQRAENQALRAEIDAVRIERDAARADLMHAQRELRSRPTQQAFDQLRKERDEWMARMDRSQNQLAETRRHAAGFQKQLANVHAALKHAQAQTATNYQAYAYWRQQAESNGATLKGVTLLAAGVGLAKLLSGGTDDDDSYDD